MPSPSAPPIPDNLKPPALSHTVLSKDWKHLAIQSPLIGFGGALTVHRPTRREEVAIRAEVAKYARTLGLTIDDWDNFSQNNAYTHYLLNLAIDEPKAGVDWLGMEVESAAANDAYLALQAEVLEWLLRFSDSETAQ